MVLVVSQETFNDAIQENIDLLGLSPEEALQETVSQFEAQVPIYCFSIKVTFVMPNNITFRE